MPASLLDSAIYRDLFSDPEIMSFFTDEAELEAMLLVEIALAEVQGRLGVIPASAAAAIGAELPKTRIDPADLAEATALNGAVVPGWLGLLRKQLSAEAAAHLHWGVTSHDISDTGLVLRLKNALDLLTGRLASLLDQLEQAANGHADLPMAGRTRSQVAVPVTFGLRIAQWAQPLLSLESDLHGLRTRLLRVQIGGAVGTNAVMAPRGLAVSDGVADALGLARGVPWHTDRLGPLGLAQWCTSLTGALERIAADLMLSSRSEIGEVKAGKAGASSTMPNKANPVPSEALVTLGRLVRTLSAGMPAAQTEERDGPAWMLEWHLLPQIVVATGAALRLGLELAGSLHPDPARMAATLGLNGGAVMAERASFLMAQHMPRPEAQALMKQLIAGRGDADLATVLTRELELDIDWQKELDPATVAAPAREIIERIFEKRGTGRA